MPENDERENEDETKDLKWIVIRPDGKKVVLTMDDLEILSDSLALVSERTEKLIKKLGWDAHPLFKQELEDLYDECNFP